MPYCYLNIFVTEEVYNLDVALRGYFRFYRSSNLVANLRGCIILCHNSMRIIRCKFSSL